jgi:hypothetical protein
MQNTPAVALGGLIGFRHRGEEAPLMRSGHGW